MVNAPPENKTRPHSLTASASAVGLYSLRGAAQIIPLPGLRPCAVCGVYVGNINLGGFNGRGALTSELYCLKCADPQGLTGGCA
jgi:hypothetical protein